jgi:hypothetical protein
VNFDGNKKKLISQSIGIECKETIRAMIDTMSAGLKKRRGAGWSASWRIFLISLVICIKAEIEDS